jgi:hypothetical protein
MLAVAGAAAAQGVWVALTPGQSEVSPGQVFDLELRLTQAGSAINGFDAVIGYDPAALTFLPLSPLSLQQGALMTGSCGNLFHRFTPGVDRVTIADVMLCAGVSVTGPGTIYKLRFQASSTPQVTQVRFLPGLQFYNAGLFVNPANATDASIGIGVSLDAGGPPRTARLVLRVAPNPARHGLSFLVESDRTGPVRISVLDVRGRMVHRHEDSLVAGETRTLAWAGIDSAGRRLPAGVYLVVLESGERSVSRRMSLVH